MAGPSSNLGSALLGGFFLWATSNEEKEKGFGEWRWTIVINKCVKPLKKINKFKEWQLPPNFCSPEPVMLRSPAPSIQPLQHCNDSHCKDTGNSSDNSNNRDANNSLYGNKSRNASNDASNSRVANNSLYANKSRNASITTPAIAWTPTTACTPTKAGTLETEGIRQYCRRESATGASSETI